ncbi:unnamed protein product [Arabis nemorensis]|uniref:RRM domain-containing protein n=1 Tax=Arabis nemorensis TaxID=586526 RepID=A0A565B1W0_9BRAS|nr:unnamed protein product [Arabis nemorensis]
MALPLYNLEDDFEIKLNMNNQMKDLNDIKETMKGLAFNGSKQSADAKYGYEMRPEFATPFPSSYSRVAYTPPQSRVFGGNDDQTIIVKGFDSSFPVYYIKSELSKYFSSCGEITSVVIPTDQVSGAVIGFEKATPIRDFGRSGREGQWPYPYYTRCDGLGHSVPSVEVLVAEEEMVL